MNSKFSTSKMSDIDRKVAYEGRNPINVAIFGSSHVAHENFSIQFQGEFRNLQKKIPGKFHLGKIMGISGARWAGDRDKDKQLLADIKAYALMIASECYYNGQIIIIVLGSNDTRKITRYPGRYPCHHDSNEQFLGDLGEKFNLPMLRKMEIRIRGLLTSLNEISGCTVVLMSTVMIYKTQLSFVNHMFQDLAKSYHHTQWCYVKLGEEYFRPEDGIHLQDSGLKYISKQLLKHVEYMPLKVVFNTGHVN